MLRPAAGARWVSQVGRVLLSCRSPRPRPRSDSIDSGYWACAPSQRTTPAQLVVFLHGGPRLVFLAHQSRHRAQSHQDQRPFEEA